jgi:choline dehydrogenase-like flavoprotein
MFIDFGSLEDSALIETDLCIIGAGAAGITLAREFAGSSVRVCMVESGGFDYEPEVQDLYMGENASPVRYLLDASRLRYFGGSTNHWTGLCAPLAPLDFRPRDWVPHSGWPIVRSELDPFYQRAQPICQLGPYAYSARVWADFDARPHDFDPAAVELCFWQQSPPTRFGETYRAELERADNVRVLWHANATNIEADESAAVVRQVDLRTLDGRTGQVKATAYVLACGGIENARLLLLSDGAEPAGLGNRHDLVGRFFMEHPHTEPGVVLANDQDRLIATYSRQSLDGVEFRPSFCAGEALQERARVLNSHVFLQLGGSAVAGVEAARELWGAARRGEVPDDLANQIWHVMRDLDDVAFFAYRKFITGEQPHELPDSRFALFSLRSEQAPNPDSRVTLTDDRDTLGLRRSRLDWRLTDLDKRSIRALTEALGAEFARLGIGRVRLADWLLADDDSWLSRMGHGNHHMGTTRMAADPRQGVVDADCRVHHVDNLYVAGSSVFATGGCANPTLTIVALALRLADHLKTRLASR